MLGKHVLAPPSPVDKENGVHVREEKRVSEVSHCQSSNPGPAIFKLHGLWHSLLPSEPQFAHLSNEADNTHRTRWCEVLRM